MKLLYVVFFLVLVAVILLVVYALVRVAIGWWRWRQGAPERRRKERLEILRENRELDDLINRSEEHTREERGTR